MTAKEEKQSELNSSLGPVPPTLPNGDQPEAQVGSNEDPSPWKIPSKRQEDGVSAKPKCAIYFSTLMRARWGLFGLQKPLLHDNPNGILRVLGQYSMKIATQDARTVDTHLYGRLAAVEVGREYDSLVAKARLDGMSEADSREFASLKLVLEGVQKATKPISQTQDLQDLHHDELIWTMKRSISIARRWKDLVDTIGVPEVALICNYDQEEIEREGLPAPAIESVSDEQYASLRTKLLDPSLDLRETCLKLHGLVGMIQRLKGLDESEIRTFLAEEIEQRVRDVLGKSNDGLLDFPEEEEDEDDESMADAEISQDMEVAGLDALKGIDFSRI
ncbi:hypothetical protein N7449_009326 [Penicillium cf. viridicatum]|uniref:Uncharacterized protein n=1 Tax=Penicillium cf. viridicatum TaxID=2972119 RepID=A0A9W9J9V0_9EURO|nr:hypothetical protein N7449_009326 [Penicillium cf. viridicatum]